MYIKKISSNLYIKKKKTRVTAQYKTSITISKYACIKNIIRKNNSSKDIDNYLRVCMY